MLKGISAATSSAPTSSAVTCSRSCSRDRRLARDRLPGDADRGGDRHARRDRRRLSGRVTSTLIMRARDVVFAIPAILLALAIVTALGPGHSRQRARDRRRLHPDLRPRRARAGALAAKRRLRPRRAGARLLATRLLLRHILPSVAGVVAVQTSLSLAWSVLAEASLSFLGLGPPPPTASLGEMVNRLEHPRRHRLVDARGALDRDRRRGRRLQPPRRRPARRRRPAERRRRRCA